MDSTGKYDIYQDWNATTGKLINNFLNIKFENVNIQENLCRITDY